VELSGRFVVGLRLRDDNNMIQPYVAIALRRVGTDLVRQQVGSNEVARVQFAQDARIRITIASMKPGTASPSSEIWPLDGSVATTLPRM
jgi:hypothetical protein